ncbi:MAG: class IV adenylate cyclase [Candidatus Methanomethylicia archaeon]
MIEVEVKVRGWDNVEEQIIMLGGVLIGIEEHLDVYFNHSSRDFKVTDEALRLRRVNSHVELTYKGPRIGSISKTREEITLTISDFNTCREMLKKLSFKEVIEVFKVRRVYRLNEFKINLDDVRGLGKYIEVEAEALSISDIPSVEEKVRKLLEGFGFHEEQFIRKTYLELLLEG